MKELHNTPLAVLDLIAGYAPLCEKLASLKTQDEVNETSNLFVSELAKLSDSLPPLNSYRSKARLSFALGCAINKHSEESLLSPSEAILKAIDIITEVVNDLPESASISDIPMENGLWAVELGSQIEETVRQLELSDESYKRIQLELIESFNELLIFTSNNALINEERTKNTISTDIGARMKYCLQKHFNQPDCDEVESLERTISEFRSIIKSYYDWVKSMNDNL